MEAYTISERKYKLKPQSGSYFPVIILYSSISYVYCSKSKDELMWTVFMLLRGGAFNAELLPTDDAPLLLAGPDSTDVIDDACQ